MVDLPGPAEWTEARGLPLQRYQELQHAKRRRDGDHRQEDGAAELRASAYQESAYSGDGSYKHGAEKDAPEPSDEVMRME